MKTTSLAGTDSRMRLATVVFPEPVPPEMPIIMLKLLDPSIDRPNHPLQQLSKRFTHSVAGRHHLFVIDRFIADPRGHVRDARNTKHLETHVPRDYRFRNRAHHNCVRTEVTQQVDLSRRFITWTRQRTVNPASHFYVDRFRFLNHQFLQISRVHRAHIRKTRSETFAVWTTQRINAHQVEVIADHHQRTLC